MTPWVLNDEIILLTLVSANRPFEKSRSQSKEDKWKVIHEAALKNPNFSRSGIKLQALRQHSSDLLNNFDPAKVEDNEKFRLLNSLWTDMKGTGTEHENSSSSKPPSQTALNKTEELVLEQSKTSKTRSSESNPKKKPKFVQEEDEFNANLKLFLSKANSLMESEEKMAEVKMKHLESQTLLNQALAREIIGRKRKKKHQETNEDSDSD